MRPHRFLSTLTLLAALAPCMLSGQADASLLAYEGFNYTAGAQLAGQSGGTGWLAGWTTPFGPPTAVAASGLAFGNLAVAPGAASTPLSTDPNPAFNVANSFRDLAAPVGTGGTMLYLSFLLRPDADFGFYGGFNLGNLFIGKSGPVATYSLESCLPACGNIAPSAVVAQAGVTAFLAVRAQLIVGADNDVFELFVNPEPGNALPAVADATLTGFDLGVTSTLVINNASAWTVDEIRIGTTFADVTPAAIPAPPAALLVAGGLMLAGLARRRGTRA